MPPNDSFKPTLVEWLEFALWKNSSQACHFHTKKIEDTAAGIASTGPGEHLAETGRARRRHGAHLRHEMRAERGPVRAQGARAPVLLRAEIADTVLPVGKKAGERAACVKRKWRDGAGTAKALKM